jgi:hypothetical protein
MDVFAVIPSYDPRSRCRIGATARMKLLDGRDGKDEKDEKAHDLTTKAE